MSEMEPEIKNFLSKILSSISLTLLWFLVNTTIGIGFNYAFFENKPSLKNYFFYLFFLLTLVLLIVYFKRKWKF